MDSWKKHFATFPQHHRLLEYLEYGFPINCEASEPPLTELTNHTSAIKFPKHVERHIQVEIEQQALVGPFEKQPFVQWCHSSPLMTREKKGSDARRIITDMSWPIGHSVNAFIPKDSYQGQPTKTTLPTLQTILQKVRQFGKNSYMSGIDISRAYSQLRVDPLDWPLQGINWDDKFYVATSIQFGSRWGAYASQSTHQAICELLKSEGVEAAVYIDDYLLIHKSLLGAQQGFGRAKELLTDLGIDQAIHKEQPPTQVIHWIGYIINTIQMTVSIPPEKIKEIIQMLCNWVTKQNASKHELQKVLGKLHYVSRCSHPARLFVGRMLNTLRAAPPKGTIALSQEFKADILWFLRFLPLYNAIHCIDPVPVKYELYIYISQWCIH
jgi:hypothetical protein